MGTESTARRKPDIGLINQPFRQSHGIIFAFNPEIEVKSARRPREEDASRGGKPVTNNVAARLGPCDLMLNEALAMVERGNTGPLHKGGHA